VPLQWIDIIVTFIILNIIYFGGKMKLNICILIAFLIICHVAECLGVPPSVIIIKGNVQEIDEKSRTCKPAENVKFTVFIDLDKSKVLENKDTSSFYTIDKKGDFKTNMYVISRDYARFCRHS
jgi:hypothetical protein